MLAHEALLQLSSPPVFVSVLLCALLGTLLQFRGRRKANSIKLKRKTGDCARTENVVGSLGNLDHAPARRRVRATFQKELEKLNHPFFQESLEGVKVEEFFKFNSRGVEVFTRSWMPESGLFKALVFICHGYGDTCTFFFEGIARKLAKSGYVVFGMDYPGFGLTSGLHCYVPSFDRLVDDVIENYSNIKGQPEFKRLPCFLFGESMGGAVALKAHLKEPNAWDGAVLVAPMCKIAADMYPPRLLVQILIVLSYFFPRAKLVPEKNLADLAFRDVEKRHQTAYNVVAYKDRPRLKTALELLRATDEISSRLQEVSWPLLILHGERDVVTDPSVSKALHKQARSTDKTLHIYENAWHSVLEGEPDDVILQAFNDIRSWLDSHSNLITRD
ncbi:hypothetical protein GOP47_0014831 [Adiantum capillus-veneris]|uniref:Serine aminopeptidase S33 domain-containing protein n=1 Tax=Adiantum capillus-veneris TaxID=13818 RepID=A0A9D4UNG9_ADICA|nr:hypothetical protein GOP47_0014831 [Adiantum capillus-veneris]